jgi:hypothetical protein
MSGNASAEFPASLRSVGRLAPALAVVGAVLFGVGLVPAGASLDRFIQFYYYGWLIVLGFTLGCYGLTLLHNVVRGSWGFPVIRIWEAGARMLPGMLITGLPIFLLREHIFPWAQAAAIANPENTVLHHRLGYLNAGAIAIRALFYFAIWIGSVQYLTGLSRKQDETHDPSLIQARTNFSAVGLVLFVLTVNFAYTDWVMSLELRWYSTIFGVWFVISNSMCALALATLIAARFANQAPYSTTVDNAVRKDHGNLLLMHTMVWAYFSFSQWVITWSGNLPDEIEFYLHRFEGGWRAVGAFLVAFQFFGPFLVLLSGKTKRKPFLLGAVAGWLILMRLIDTCWQIFPSFKDTNPLFLVPAIGAALIGLGIWLTFVIRSMSGALAIPVWVEPTKDEEVLNHA